VRASVVPLCCAHPKISGLCVAAVAASGTTRLWCHSLDLWCGNWELEREDQTGVTLSPCSKDCDMDSSAHIVRIVIWTHRATQARPKAHLEEQHISTCTKSSKHQQQGTTEKIEKNFPIWGASSKSSCLDSPPTTTGCDNRLWIPLFCSEYRIMEWDKSFALWWQINVPKRLFQKKCLRSSPREPHKFFLNQKNHLQHFAKTTHKFIFSLKFNSFLARTTVSLIPLILLFPIE
jgi:hypothetical protein